MNLYQKVNKSIKKFDLLSQTEAETKYLQNFGVRKNFYVGGANASDTLDKGRGETIDKPFASINAALAYISNTCHSPKTYVYILEDMTPQENIQLECSPNGILYITSGSSSDKKTISFSENRCFSFSHESGSGKIVITNLNIINENPVSSTFYSGESKADLNITFTNVKFTDKNSAGTISISSPCCVCWLGPGIEFADCGSRCSVLAYNGGTVAAYYGSSITYTNCNFTEANIVARDGGSVHLQFGEFSGDVTGKRYISARGGRIFTYNKGPNLIPGTIDGECDETSSYI